MSRRRFAETGQSLPEFALIAPLFFLLIFGIIQFGILFGGQIGLSNAAREVARYASTVPANASSATVTAQADSVINRGVPANNGSAITTVSYCWYPNPTNPITYSQKVIIRISYAHTLFIPLVGVLVDQIDGVSDNRLAIETREEMKVEALPTKTQPTGTACGANP